jgi:hypothetical protein
MNRSPADLPAERRQRRGGLDDDGVRGGRGTTVVRVDGGVLGSMRKVGGGGGVHEPGRADGGDHGGAGDTRRSSGRGKGRHRQMREARSWAASRARRSEGGERRGVRLAA